MCTISEMKARVEGVLDTVLSLAGECMMQNNEQIVALLVHQQYDEGVDSFGNPLPQYRPRYSVMKYKLTGRGQKADLNLTGEFQAGIELRVDEESNIYQLDSPAQTEDGELKSEWLAKWADAPIMDLTDENKKEAWLIILPDFVDKVKELLEA